MRILLYFTNSWRGALAEVLTHKHTHSILVYMYLCIDMEEQLQVCCENWVDRLVLSVRRLELTLDDALHSGMFTKKNVIL